MIREAVVEDIPEVLRMLRLFQEEAPAWSQVEYNEDYLRQSLRDGMLSGHMLLMIDSAYRGLMLATVGQQWYSPEIVSAEEILFVLPEHRGGMLAYRLLTSIANAARRKGAIKLYSGVSTGNANAIAMYRRLGFAPFGTSFVKEL